MPARSELVPLNSDPALHPFLIAEDETTAERDLEDLLAGIGSFVRELAHSRLQSTSREGSQPWEIEDISSEVQLQLLIRLRELRQNPELDGIENFRGYVAAVVHNACTQRLRSKYPERQKLKNRLRYVLNHDLRFGLWKDAVGSSVCGLAEWKDRRDASSAVDRLDLSDNLRRLAPGDLIEALFTISTKPVPLDALVALVAKIWGIQDLRREENKNEKQGEPWVRIADRRVNVSSQVEQRMYLAALWKEIRELRRFQRIALLLNLHDASGQDMLPLFVLLDVARLAELASAMEMATGELADLWNSLPLDDASIANRLGIKRQQVINLRKSARERLARRMAKSW